MADLSKFKRKSSLGAPPPITEASENLNAPESAPADLVVSAPPPSSQPAPRGREGDSAHDGRSARRTGRTVQFATRVSPEFDERVRAIAKRERRLLVEILERALDAYETGSRSREMDGGSKGQQ